MITISLCMIVKNEEDTLARCLESVQSIVDEINIVDTGSTDRTKEIAGRFTERVFDFKWIDHFAAARNYSFQQATKDYILWLDADDVFLEEDQKKLRELKATLDPSVDAVSMNYNLAFDAAGNVKQSLRRNRLVKRTRNFQWIGAVHEYLEVGGHIIAGDLAVSHKSIKHDANRNIMIYEKMLEQGQNFTPRDLYYYANELKDHQQFEKAISYYKRFLDTKQGWIEDNIAACGKIADCYNALKQPEEEVNWAIQSFRYDTPRADFCCRLGYYFLTKREYEKAVFWYNLATTLEKPKNNLGFINHACWTWLPHLQLCICYDRLGQYERSYAHNEAARHYVPNDWRVLHNKKYLEERLAKLRETSEEQLVLHQIREDATPKQKQDDVQDVPEKNNDEALDRTEQGRTENYNASLNTMEQKDHGNKESQTKLVD